MSSSVVSLSRGQRISLDAEVDGGISSPMTINSGLPVGCGKYGLCEKPETETPRKSAISRRSKNDIWIRGFSERN
jgi:hypothetical protein